MQNQSVRPAAQPTLAELQQIHREVQAACAELHEMLEVGGDIRRIWRKRRKYFVPEIGSCIPFPNCHIWRIVKPVWTIPESHDLRIKDLVQDIVLGVQWWEVPRREIIPERFM